MLSLSKIDSAPSHEYVFKMKRFSQLDMSQDASLAEPADSSFAENVDTSQGILKRIEGFGPVKLEKDGREYPVSQLPAPVNAFFEMRASNSENSGYKNLFYAGTDGNLYSFDYESQSGSFVASAVSGTGNTGNAFSYFTQYKSSSQNKAIMGSKDCGPFVYEENGTYFITYSQNKPHFSRAVMHYSRLFGVGDRSHPERIWFSAIDSPSEFEVSPDKGGYIDITDNIGDTLDVVSLFDTLYVICRFGIVAVNTLSTQSDFSLENAYYSDSEIIEGSISVSGRNIFFATRNGVYAFGGTSVTCVSNKIKNFFAKNNVTVQKETSIFFEGKYFLTFHSPDGRTGMLIYNTEHASWQIFSDTDVSAMAVIRDRSKEKLICAFSSSASIGEWKNGNLRGSSGTIASVWKSPDNLLGSPQTTKTVKEIHFSASGNGEIEITVFADEKEQTRTVLLTENRKQYRVQFDICGGNVSFEIKNKAGCDFAVLPLTLIYREEREYAK